MRRLALAISAISLLLAALSSVSANASDCGAYAADCDAPPAIRVVAAKTILVGQRPTVQVSVQTRGGSRPDGVITVRYAHVRTGASKRVPGVDYPGHSVEIRGPKLKLRGAYNVKIVYTPADSPARATMKTLRIVVRAK